MLVIRGVNPRYPFGPSGKERGDQTLDRSITTINFPIRPLSPRAGRHPQLVNHIPRNRGGGIRQATFALKSAPYRRRFPVIAFVLLRGRTELNYLSDFRGPPQAITALFFGDASSAALS